MTPAKHMRKPLVIPPYAPCPGRPVNTATVITELRMPRASLWYSWLFGGKFFVRMSLWLRAVSTLLNRELTLHPLLHGKLSKLQVLQPALPKPRGDADPRRAVAADLNRHLASNFFKE